MIIYLFRRVVLKEFYVIHNILRFSESTVFLVHD